MKLAIKTNLIWSPVRRGRVISTTGEWTWDTITNWSLKDHNTGLYFASICWRSHGRYPQTWEVKVLGKTCEYIKEEDIERTKTGILLDLKKRLV